MRSAKLRSFVCVSPSKQPAQHFLRQLKKLELNLPWDQTEYQSIVPDLPVTNLKNNNYQLNWSRIEAERAERQKDQVFGINSFYRIHTNLKPANVTDSLTLAK